MASFSRDPAHLFAPPEVEIERRPGGVQVLRSPLPLGAYGRSLGLDLEHWGRVAPERPFLRERGPDGQWRGPTYGEALDLVRRIGTALLDRPLGPDRPIVVLSDNSVEHALLTLAAMHVGIPVAPVSPAYSTMSRDFGKLRAILALAEPGLVYVNDPVRYGPALAVAGSTVECEIVAGLPAAGDSGATPFSVLIGGRDDAAIDRRFGAVGPDTVAKLLFTSGSTGDPKGVVNTQRMLCANQQAKAQLWPFLAAAPPVIVDWLPWSHTFGGNHNFNLVLRHGGTLYIDAGRPVPGLFEQTVANLTEIAPTIYFNVPRGYDMLVTALRRDPALRRNFFSRLQIVFYAAAALPQHLWEALDSLARETVGEPVTLTSGWGSTETAPLAADCHFQAAESGVIGLPAPGTDLKLVPNGEKLEVRVRGPNVTPGYWRRPDLTASHFDEEGFYLIGDAVRFADPERPEQGLVFDGRVSEDFKLDSGTWVSVGMLRVKAVAALAPVAQDIAVAGHDRSEIGFLVFPNLAACRQLAAGLPADAPVERVLADPAVRDTVRRGLGALRAAGQGSSSFASRALLLTEAPSIDAGEITDKGYLNQRSVLHNRADLVAALYSAGDRPDVIEIDLVESPAGGHG